MKTPTRTATAQISSFPNKQEHRRMQNLEGRNFHKRAPQINSKPYDCHIRSVCGCVCVRERKRAEEEDTQISQIREMQLVDPRTEHRLHMAGAASSVTINTRRMNVSRFPPFLLCSLLLLLSRNGSDAIVAALASFWIWLSSKKNKNI